MSACRRCANLQGLIVNRESAVRAAARKAARTENPKDIEAIATAKAVYAEQKRVLAVHQSECEVAA